MSLAAMPCSGIGRGWPSAARRCLGTTVKDPQQVPTDLVADEKGTWVAGQEVLRPDHRRRGLFPGGECGRSRRYGGVGDGLWRVCAGSTGPRASLSPALGLYRWLESDA